MAIKNAKKILNLKRRKLRQAEQKYLIEGIRLCEEALKSSDTLEQLIFCRESIARNTRLENLYQATLAQRIPIQQTDWRAFKHMSDTDTPQGVLGVVSMPTYDPKTVLNTNGPFLILDRVSDPGNLGVIMRTAEAAGCKGIFLTRGSVEVYNPKVVRATMGAIFRMPVFPLQDGPALLHSTPPAQHPDHRSTHQRHLFPQTPNPKSRCPPPRQRSLWHRPRPPRPIPPHRHHTHGRPGRIAQHRSRKRYPAL